VVQFAALAYGEGIDPTELMEVVRLTPGLTTAAAQDLDRTGLRLQGFMAEFTALHGRYDDMPPNLAVTALAHLLAGNVEVFIKVAHHAGSPALSYLSRLQELTALNDNERGVLSSMWIIVRTDERDQQPPRPASADGTGRPRTLPPD